MAHWPEPLLLGVGRPAGAIRRILFVVAFSFQLVRRLVMLVAALCPLFIRWATSRDGDGLQERDRLRAVLILDNHQGCALGCVCTVRSKHTVRCDDGESERQKAKICVITVMWYVHLGDLSYTAF